MVERIDAEQSVKRFVSPWQLVGRTSDQSRLRRCGARPLKHSQGWIEAEHATEARAGQVGEPVTGSTACLCDCGGKRAVDKTTQNRANAVILVAFVPPVMRRRDDVVVHGLHESHRAASQPSGSARLARVTLA